MHIVHILPELKQGGVETVVVGLTRELVKAGHRCTVISNGGKLVSDVVAAGGVHCRLNVCSKNPLTFFNRVRKLQTALSKLQPDIIHAHSRVPAWLAWFANKKPKIPFVTTVHGFNSVSRYSAIMTKGDRVICVSHPVKDYVQQHYKTPDTLIDVIHPGVNPIEFNPETLDRKWITDFKEQFELEGNFVATAVGRITELKDYETFIRAIAIAAKSNPNIRGLIVGGVRRDKQAYYGRLQELVRELDIGQHVLFVGSHTHMAEIYALSDILVSCSKKPESFGLTLIEALAMNTPVIASRHGGPLDIIQEGRNGFFFEPGDAQALAALLTAMPALTESDYHMDITARFSLSRMTEATLAVYNEVVGA